MCEIVGVAICSLIFPGFISAEESAYDRVPESDVPEVFTDACEIDVIGWRGSVEWAMGSSLSSTENIDRSSPFQWSPHS